jgi:hypothetical protein
MKKLFNLFLAFVLTSTVAMQSGCNKDHEKNANPDVTVSADTIYGTLKYRQVVNYETTVVDWPFGTAVIKAIPEGKGVISSANVNADGTFCLILPATVSGSYFINLSDVITIQGGNVKANPKTVRLLGLNLVKVDYTDKGDAKSIHVNLCTLNDDLTIDKSYFYNLYDQDGTFKGIGLSSGNMFDWTFNKGWGLVETYQINSCCAALDSKSVKSTPASAIWIN